MYVHLGGDLLVRSTDLITILDYSQLIEEQGLQSFLLFYEGQKQVIWISDKQATKSIVITDDHIYGSPISSQTLQKRTIEETKTD